jgi:hypothetical protein
VKKSKLIVPSLLIALGTQCALAMTFKAQIQPLKLPRTLLMSQPAQVPDTVAGDLSVGLMRMCGDGDVANFSKEHPSFDFVPQTTTKLDVITGYWITDAEDKNPVPTKENFYPVAYVKDLAIANTSAAVKFADTTLPINHALSTPINGLKVLSIDMINVYRNATRAFGANKSYRLYAGTFTCMNVDDGAALVSKENSDYKFNPSPVEITHVFTHPLGLKAKAETEAVNSGSDKMRMSVSTQPSTDSLYTMEPDEVGVRFPYQFKFESSGDISLSGTESFELYKKVMAYSLPKIEDAPSSSTADPKEPASAADKIKYYNEKINGMKNAFGVVPGTSDSAKISYCKGLGLDVSTEKSTYKWEAFPMNASCKFLHNDSDLSEAYTDMFREVSSLTVIPDEAKFSSYKRNLAKRFYAANAIEVAQKNLNNSSALKLSHANCFNSGSNPIIGRVVGSYPLHFTPDSSGARFTILPNANNHVHPEPLFALSDWKQYSASDVHGIWGQVIQSTPTYAPVVDGDSTLDGPGSYVPPSGGIKGKTMEEQEAEFDPRDWSILLPLNDKVQILDRKIDGKTFQVPGINILFKIRSVGGSCPGFC